MRSPDVHTVRARLAASASALDVPESAAPGLDGLRRQLVSLQCDLEGRPTLLVAGAYGAGKSTVVNALLGADIAPTDPRPTTAVVTRFVHGPPGALLVFDDRPAETVTIERWRQLADQNHLDDHPEDLPVAAALRDVEVQVPAPFLERVDLIDTPGFNSSNDGHDERTRRALSLADLVLWVSNATHAARASELDALRDAQDPDGADRPTLVLVTGADLVPPRALDAPDGPLRRMASGVGLGDVHAFSGLCAAQDRGNFQDRNAEALKALDAFIEREGASAVAARVTRQADAALRTASDSLASRADDLRAAGAYLETCWRTFRAAVTEEAQRLALERAGQAAAHLDRALLGAAQRIRMAVTASAERAAWRPWTTRTNYTLDRNALKADDSLRREISGLVSRPFVGGRVPYFDQVGRFASTLLADLMGPSLQSAHAGLLAGVLPDGAPEGWVRDAFETRRAAARRSVADLQERLHARLKGGSLSDLFDEIYPRALVDARCRLAYQASIQETADRLAALLAEPVGPEAWARHTGPPARPVPDALDRLRADVFRPALRGLDETATLLADRAERVRVELAIRIRLAV